MSNEEKIRAFAQSLYLAKNGRYYDDITSSDGQEYITQTIDWANQLIDELEIEADWNYARGQDTELGVVGSNAQAFELPTDVRKLVTDEFRPLTIRQDGTVVSSWAVVQPDMISDPTNYDASDRVSAVNGILVFSRPLDDTELSGTVVADVINYLPRLSTSNTKILDVVKPKQLLILGILKNSTLPDVVQGGLSPSFAQKYADLLSLAKAENDATSVARGVMTDDYGYIGGIGI